MNLRDCLIRHGIVNSRRVCRLPLACQLFFRNLLHTCDGAGRFIADADDLRLALYRHALDRVSRLHVSRWLAECHSAELVRLYTGPDGRGYGEVLKYGQRDKNRRAIHPARDPEQLALAPPGFEPGEPPDPGPPPELNRREKKPPTPAAAGAAGEGDSISDVQSDLGYRTQAQIDAELFRTLAGLEGSPVEMLTTTGRRSITAALSAIRRVHRGLCPMDLERAAAAWKKLFPTASLTARAMATHWAKLQGTAAGAIRPAAIVEDEPDGWRDWINEHTPDTPYARGGDKEGTPWRELDACYRRYLIEQCRRRETATAESAA